MPSIASNGSECHRTPVWMHCSSSRIYTISVDRTFHVWPLRILPARRVDPPDLPHGQPLPNLEPSWNIAPTQLAPVVRRHPSPASGTLISSNGACCDGGRRTRRDQTARSRTRAGSGRPGPWHPHPARCARRPLPQSGRGALCRVSDPLRGSILLARDGEEYGLMPALRRTAWRLCAASQPARRARRRLRAVARNPTAAPQPG